MAADPARSKALEWSVVLLPFSLGYFLSYLFRTINGPLSGGLAHDFGLGEAGLGLLTSVYLLVICAAQLPVGIALDRFGPRRVQMVLLPAVIAGAIVFSCADNVAFLVLGRALIGLGSAGALMAGLKVAAAIVPKSRLALVNGLLVMAGGLGATAATAPAEWITDRLGWRGTFLVLAGVTPLILIWIVLTKVPAPAKAKTKVGTGLMPILRSRGFWRFAPLSACLIGTAFSLHGLWAARWMSDVDGLSDHAASMNMVAMGIGLTLGAALLGVLASVLRARNIPASRVFLGGCIVYMLLQTLLVWHHPLPGWLPGWAPWTVIAVFGGMTALSFSVTAESVPEEAIGRMNTVLNVMHIGMAFLIQASLGLIITALQNHVRGLDVASAFRIAFAVPLVLQAVALAWFLMPLASRRGRQAEPFRQAPPDSAAYAAAEKTSHNQATGSTV